MQVRSQQGDTADQLCWRHLGRTEAVVEAMLDINPGLAALGPVLPAGTLVTLPDLPTTPTRPTVQLWD
ncbi:phage tail protein [Rhodococcus sp. SRB_17]|uniref:tail protein X n=1 Tax=Acidovorax sp. SRB_24 TaxID=1962700 RepID=UPI00145F8379|nr:tail protein X [Acidovorax sp. SRB_24]NMM75566.1 phage tail protein [Acidovorax sp. SRB_24]NMM85087.1 phage tail protein [Rhodococcus sp. SRB_17]